MDKVSLNGVELFPFSTEDELLRYVDDNKGILVAINAEKILHATDETRELINRNIGYCDGMGAMKALQQKGYKNACKIPGCELWLKIVEHLHNNKSFYLVGGRQEVIDETKRIIDTCAPGGGFIFETSCGLDYCSHENVEAMFDTVRTYGKH